MKVGPRSQAHGSAGVASKVKAALNFVPALSGRLRG